ncbi:Zn-dependent hydrolase [Lachnospiraceae bacterium KM106-2]|nr:Zn-dependent hydrolase [Lachnospiraceae bacterium KM106-2]
MNLCSIASGSSGNCIYVGNQNTHILVDVGISGKRVEAGLNQINIDPAGLNGIVITHEHSDHISGLGVIARRYKVPIYATVETMNAILHTKSVGKIDESFIQIIQPDQSFMIQDVMVNPYSISHDASNPVCYTFIHDDKKVGVATDLGTYDDYLIKSLKGCEILLLEANHDIHMLQVGSYPYVLKRRILGDLGHLSNDNSGRLLLEIFHDKMKHVVLGHLSKENNYPELAYETVKYEIMKENPEILEKCELTVANRDVPSAFLSCS